jgi:hypothetical protein
MLCPASAGAIETSCPPSAGPLVAPAIPSASGKARRGRWPSAHEAPRRARTSREPLPVCLRRARELLRDRQRQRRRQRTPSLPRWPRRRAPGQAEDRAAAGVPDSTAPKADPDRHARDETRDRCGEGVCRRPDERENTRVHVIS